MSENATRAAGAPHPIDLATLPRPSRTLLKLLTSLPTWTAEGWAHPSDEHLRIAGEYRDKRPIQRARKPLVVLGLVEHRRVRKGELLPNGERARWPHYIYLAGPALRPSNDDGEGEPSPKERCENGTEAVPQPLGSVPFWPPRSVDPEDRIKKVRSSARPEPLTRSKSEEQTFSFPIGSTETASPPRTLPAPEVATEVLACQVARHWIAATGLGWKRVDNDLIAVVTPFLEGMNGDATSKVTRACRVIDVVVREQLAAGNEKTSLRFIFHREMFWKRLGTLDDPNAKPLTKAARRPLDASNREAGPKVSPRPQSSLETDCGPRIDTETMLRDQERLWPEGPRPASSPVVATSSERREDVAKELAEEIAKLRANPPAPVSSDRRADIAKELADAIAKLSSPPATSSEKLLGEREGPAVIVAAGELEACAELAKLAETVRVRRAVWDREAKELEEREEDAERMKRARWAKRGELVDDEHREGPGVRSTAATSLEGHEEGSRRVTPTNRRAA